MSSSRRGARTMLGTGAALSTLVALALAGGPAVSAPAAGGADGRLVPEAMPLRQALQSLDQDERADVAALNGWSVSQLVAESTDRMLNMDRTGRLFYVDDFASGHADHADGQSTSGARVDLQPQARTFELHSLPGSKRTIYLDFNGHIVTGTAWNGLTGTNPQVYGAYDTDGNPNVFGAAEKVQIEQTWRRVAEDYAPFNVDVTTQEPAPGKIDRESNADLVYGTRLVVTPGGDVYTDYCGSNCGGVAYVNVFDVTGADHSFYQPGFVFTDGVGTGAKNIAEAASHEVGHNLSLHHDGTSVLGYYAGHGPWAPIMGVGYYRPVSQWSQGEYDDANNTEDDLTMIRTSGAPLRHDDHGDTIGSATLTGSNRGKGVITDRLDKDVFRITSTGGQYTVSATPATLGANLDIVMRLMRPNGTPLAVVDPAVGTVNAGAASGLNASVTLNLPAGKYYVQIRGAGFGNPLNTGYSTYGSLGAYKIKAVK